MITGAGRGSECCGKVLGVAGLSIDVRATEHKTPGESSEIRMRLLEGSFTLYTSFTSLSVRVSRIRAKLVCLSITS